LSADQLVEAKKFADALGGAEQVTKAVVGG
jgi:hypothetical protein